MVTSLSPNLSLKPNTGTEGFLLLSHFGFLVCVCVCVCVCVWFLVGVSHLFRSFISACVTPISVCVRLILAPFWLDPHVCAQWSYLRICWLVCVYMCMYVCTWWHTHPSTLSASLSLSPSLLCNKSSCGCREAMTDSIAAQDLRLLSYVDWRRREARLLEHSCYSNDRSNAAFQRRLKVGN